MMKQIIKGYCHNMKEKGCLLKRCLVELKFVQLKDMIKSYYSVAGLLDLLV
jgi:hypothetical protein